MSLSGLHNLKNQRKAVGGWRALIMDEESNENKKNKDIFGRNKLKSVKKDKKDLKSHTSGELDINDNEDENERNEITVRKKILSSILKNLSVSQFLMLNRSMKV